MLQEHLRGIINAHVLETGSFWGENILNGFEQHYAGLFKLIKPKTAGISTLLGHRSTRPEETLIEVD